MAAQIIQLHADREDATVEALAFIDEAGHTARAIRQRLAQGDLLGAHREANRLADRATNAREEYARLTGGSAA